MSWAQYDPACGCATCHQLRAFSNSAQAVNSFELNGYTAKALNRAYGTQDYAQPVESKNNNSAREMTAEDLGLHPDFLRRMEHERAIDATLARLSVLKWWRAHGDVPFGFWLGREAA